MKQYSFLIESYKNINKRIKFLKKLGSSRQTPWYKREYNDLITNGIEEKGSELRQSLSDLFSQKRSALHKGSFKSRNRKIQNSSLDDLIDVLSAKDKHNLAQALSDVRYHTM